MCLLIWENFDNHENSCSHTSVLTSCWCRGIGFVIIGWFDLSIFSAWNCYCAFRSHYSLAFLAHWAPDPEPRPPLEIPEKMAAWMKTHINNNRHPSVRLTMDSILVVCLAWAPASVAEEVFVTETASVLCLWSVEAVALFSTDPSLCGGLCQLLLTWFEVFSQSFSPLEPVGC